MKIRYEIRNVSNKRLDMKSDPKRFKTIFSTQYTSRHIQERNRTVVNFPLSFSAVLNSLGVLRVTTDSELISTAENDNVLINLDDYIKVTRTKRCPMRTPSSTTRPRPAPPATWRRPRCLPNSAAWSLSL